MDTSTTVSVVPRWKLDLEDERLWDGPNAIKLTPKAFNMLRYFASHPRRLITKAELLESVWHDTYITEGLVKDYVADLRRALRDNAKEPDYIETVHGRGYRLIGEITLVNKPKAQSTLQTTTPEKASVTFPVIAVLPFAPMNMDPRWDLLTDGLCADTIYELTRFPDLNVIAYKSSAAYKGSNERIVDIGTCLGASYVLDGTIQSAGERVRIVTTLVDVQSGNQLWSDRYDGENEDIFQLQDNIVEKIATSLSGFHGEIFRAERKRLGRKVPSSLEAYELYLLGYEKEATLDRSNTDSAIKLLEKAISIDPMFARAWTVLGWTCNNAATYCMTDHPKVLRKRGRHAVLRAVELDPRDPFAVVERGALYARENDLVSARECFERALDIGANNVDASVITAKYVAFVLGRPQQALHMLDRALELNPFAPAWYYIHVVRISFFCRDYASVVDAARRSIDIPHTRIFEMLAQAKLGKHTKVRALYNTFREKHPGYDFDVLIAQIPLVIGEHILSYRQDVQQVLDIMEVE